MGRVDSTFEVDAVIYYEFSLGCDDSVFNSSEHIED